MKNPGMKKFIFLCGMLLSIIIICEATGRIFLKVKYGTPAGVCYKAFGYDREPLLGFELLPKIKKKFFPMLGTVFSTNSLGLRGAREYGKKQENELRVAILGESCVFGFKASGDETTIAGYLEQKLTQAFPQQTISVINAGNPGYVSFQTLARLQLRLLPLEPDIIVLYMGWNDFGFPANIDGWKRDSFIDSDLFFSMDSWQSFINAKNKNNPCVMCRPFALTFLAPKIINRFFYRQCALAKLRYRNKAMAMLGNFYDNLSSIVAIAQYRDIPVILVTLASEYNFEPDARKAINDVIRRVAQESNSFLLDADAFVSSNRVQGINDSKDYYHFVDKGNAFMASLIADQIVAMLKH
ncbi:MAG: SGNH/GDSL hydrolase family protein [Candidatus Omnitrophica bacterium]|nr:SGNH/GDSL hydrolase family protein [Candidatus Omnitrophota bacterium]